MRQCKNCTSTISSKNNPKGKGILYYHVEQGLSINYWCWNVKSKVTGCNNPEPKKRAGVTNE